jgi:hypothetical protein
LKRYIVFLYHGNFSEGGWADFHSAYNDIVDAKNAIVSELGYKNIGAGSAQIVDVMQSKIIESASIQSGTLVLSWAAG